MAPGQELVTASTRPLTEEEIAENRKRAFELDVAIKVDAVAIHKTGWRLAEHLWEMKQISGWLWLSEPPLSVEEWLASPELGFTRRWYEFNVRLWEELVVSRDAKAPSYEEVSISKAIEVLPAIVKGEVEMEEALSDAKTLGWRDLRAQYHGGDATKKELDAESEPTRVECPGCGRFILEQELRPPFMLVDGEVTRVDADDG